MSKLKPFEDEWLPKEQPPPDDQPAMRRYKLRKLKEAGRDPFDAVQFNRTHTIAELLAKFDELASEEVRLAGRIRAKRGHGKAIFFDLADASGRIQLFSNVDVLGERNFGWVKELDLGDIVGVVGELFRTRTGEKSVRVKALAMLAKALEPLPEKWHGLTDVEQRYRHRYLDLIMSDDVRQRFRLRSQIIAEMRRFLDGRDFMEVETPVLEPIAGGATANPFITHYEALDSDFYLRIAMELKHKRLIVGGFERIYEIGRIFRNEGISTRHNPEFTMLELYWAYVDYGAILKLVEDMLVQLADSTLGTRKVKLGDTEIDLSPPYQQAKFDDLLLAHTGARLEELPDKDAAVAKLRELGLEFNKDAPYEKLLDELWSKAVEPQLVQPVFVMDYPLALSPLAKRIPDKPLFTYRFELYIGGMEIANAFSELNDPIDQRARMQQQIAHAVEGYRELDEDFLLALEYGMPPTGGLGIGIDRLLMLLTGQTSIREVILFPQLRKEA
ncbi:MAG: lysine--tRNA ligase [Planctomycetales bacterium 4484_113]|nr:MAG: lysine--tRNA ligase [Planctomycetales bacterium 4484_113]